MLNIKKVDVWNTFGNILFLSFFLGPHLWHTEVPMLGVELELHLTAFATATAIPEAKLRLQPTLQLMAMLDP